MKKIYLAIPYTFNPELAFEVANKVAAKLMDQGKIVFSPISHSHPISKYIKNPQTHDFWMSQDLPMLLTCDELYLVVIGDNGYQLIENSRGCQEEIETAEINQIPIIYYDYDE